MNAEAPKGDRILLVEDEESLAIALEYNLAEEGYRVVRAADGRRALECFSGSDFDLVILDIMLPYLDGFAVAQEMRARSPRVPILMLTARSAQADKIRGLEIGADDYLTKPFHLRELLLRVRGMLRRRHWYETRPARCVFGDNEIDFASLSARAGKQSFRLTPLEAMLCKYLTDRAGRVVSRQELLREVWQVPADIDTRTVDNFMVRLRRYFEADPARPLFFLNVRGAGYLFQHGDEQEPPGRRNGEPPVPPDAPAGAA
jgi:two-component system alkaline phosphatase synthesis response regulator PhoP